MATFQTAVLIPTHNSPTRFGVICEYLDQLTGIRRVYVADSSDHDLSDICPKHSTYLRFDNCNLIEKIARALEDVTEDYILLHPDGELLNPIALLDLEKQCRENKFISALSLNLSVTYRCATAEISLRNYPSYRFMAKNVASGNIHQRQFLTPYYQLIWGFHKTSFLKQFFNLARHVEWFAGDGVNIAIFERLFNVFMMLQGKIILSELPLFIRCDDHSANRSKWSRLCHIDEWLKHYSAGDKECRKIISTISAQFAKPLGLGKDEFSTLLIECLRSEVQNGGSIRDITISLLQKMFNAAGVARREICPSADMTHGRIILQAQRAEISKNEFRELSQKQIMPFIASRHADIFKFGVR